MLKPCDGNCHPHIGEVQTVHVWHGSTDWGKFNYCEYAIGVDEQQGFTIEVITDGERRAEC